MPLGQPIWEGAASRDAGRFDRSAWESEDRPTASVAWSDERIMHPGSAGTPVSALRRASVSLAVLAFGGNVRMITRTRRDVPAGSQLEVNIHWAAGQPPVVTRLDQRGARELIARLAFAAPDALEDAVAGVESEAAMLVLGLQAYCRHVREQDGDLAVADVEGALWTIPACRVRAIRLRLVPAAADACATAEAADLRRAFGFCPASGSGRC